MPKSTWVFASILSALALLAIGLLQLRESGRRAATAEAAAEGAESRRRALSETNALLAAQLASVTRRVGELEEEIARAAEARDTLEDQMRSALESRDVTISELQGQLTVNILDRVLFDSGEAELKPEGEAILLQVARVLAGFPRREIQVLGHTDHVPITTRTRGGFTDNWSLSTGRALAAVRFLASRAGVDPRRLAAVGCGEFRPLADNSTPEGRARNRRIAVVVLPERVHPLDVPAVSRSTNAPPAAGARASAPASGVEEGTLEGNPRP